MHAGGKARVRVSSTDLGSFDFVAGRGRDRARSDAGPLCIRTAETEHVEDSTVGLGSTGGFVTVGERALQAGSGLHGVADLRGKLRQQFPRRFAD